MATHSWTSGVCCDSSCFYAVRPSEILASSRQSQKPTKQILVSFSDSTGASADETCRPNTFPFIACLHWSNVRLKEIFGRPKVQSVVNTQQPTHKKKRSVADTKEAQMEEIKRRPATAVSVNSRQWKARSLLLLPLHHQRDKVIDAFISALHERPSVCVCGCVRPRSASSIIQISEMSVSFRPHKIVLCNISVRRVLDTFKLVSHSENRRQFFEKKKKTNRRNG